MSPWVYFWNSTTITFHLEWDKIIKTIFLHFVRVCHKRHKQGRWKKRSFADLWQDLVRVSVFFSLKAWEIGKKETLSQTLVIKIRMIRNSLNVIHDHSFEHLNLIRFNNFKKQHFCGVTQLWVIFEAISNWFKKR